MRGHEAGQITAAGPGGRKREALHARHIGVPAGQVPRLRLSESGCHGRRRYGQHGKVGGTPRGLLPRLPSQGQQRARADVRRQARGGRVTVGQPHIRPPLTKGERHRGPDQPGADHHHAAGAGSPGCVSRSPAGCFEAPPSLVARALLPARPPGRFQAPPSLVARSSLLSPGGTAPRRLAHVLLSPGGAAPLRLAHDVLRPSRVHWAMSSRSAAAPRRYTCCSAERGWPVSTCISRRTTRGIAPGTPISDAHSSGTSWKPILRAASAGNSAVRSGVAVNRTLITSSVTRLFRVMTSETSSVVPSRIAARSFASIWTAPRIALTVTSLLLHAASSCYPVPVFPWVTPVYQV